MPAYQKAHVTTYLQSAGSSLPAAKMFNASNRVHACHDMFRS